MEGLPAFSAIPITQDMNIMFCQAYLLLQQLSNMSQERSDLLQKLCAQQDYIRELQMDNQKLEDLCWVQRQMLSEQKGEKK